MKPISTLRARWRRYRGDSKGVAALEFCMLLPLLLTMLVGGIEVVLFTWTKGRVQDAAAMVSDITAQNVSVDEQRMRGIFGAAHRMLDPLGKDAVDMSNLELTVSSVIACPCDGDLENATPDSEYCFTVLWSHRLLGDLPADGAGVPAGRAQESTIDFVPSRLARAPNETLIVTETDFTYDPEFQYILLSDWFDMREETYFRPRLADRVLHSGDQEYDQEPNCQTLLED